VVGAGDAVGAGATAVGAGDVAGTGAAAVGDGDADGDGVAAADEGGSAGVVVDGGLAAGDALSVGAAGAFWPKPGLGGTSMDMTAASAAAS